MEYLYVVDYSFTNHSYKRKLCVPKQLEIRKNAMHFKQNFKCSGIPKRN